MRNARNEDLGWGLVEVIGDHSWFFGLGWWQAGTHDLRSSSTEEERCFFA